MKHKVSALIDGTLYERARATARREGRGVDGVIEEALARYLAIQAPQPSLVDQTRGTFTVSERAFRAILRSALLE